MRRAVIVAFFALGCGKTEAKVDPVLTAPIVPAPTAVPEGTAATATATATASASATASAFASGSPSAPASATAKVAPKELPLTPAATRVTGKNFALDLTSPGCRADAPCTMTLRLTVTGDYHVNKEYPYKFVAAASPGVTFLGKGDASTFSRASGDFREEGEKNATMTVRFTPKDAGEVKVLGTYKMSVCSAENCQIESQTVALSVPVR